MILRAALACWLTPFEGLSVAWLSLGGVVRQRRRQDSHAALSISAKAEGVVNVGTQDRGAQA